MATGVGVALVQAEWRARCHRPSSGIVRHGAWPADEVDAGQIVGHVGGVGANLDGEMVVVVGGAVGFALAAGAIVGHEHHDGVVPCAHLGQGVAQCSDGLVEMVHSGGIGGHVGGKQPAPVIVEIVPCRHLVAGFVISWRQGSTRRHNAQFDLPGVTAGSDLVPSAVVHTGVPLDVRGSGVQWGVGSRMGEVHQKRLVGAHRMSLANHGDGGVGEIVGEVVTLGVGVDIEMAVVADQLVRVVQIGEAVEDSVEPLETPLHRP